jgi:ParB family chromosome partitioning protein
MTTENNIEFAQGSVKKATDGMTSADLWKCPIDRIVVDPDFNVRIHDADYEAHIRALADSIKVNGFMADKPLAGYVGKDDTGADIIILTDGHSRLTATKLAVSEGAEIDVLPMVTKPRGTSMEDLTVALVTSNSGRQLGPFEVALVCKRLVGYGMEPPAIAKRLGYGKAYIDGLLDLVAAPKAVRDLVISGKVSATLAIETLKKHGKAAGKVLTEGVKQATASGKERVTKKHVEAKAKKGAQKAAKASKLPTQPQLPGVAVDANVALLEKAAEWKTSYYAYPDASQVEDLIKLMAHLTGLDESDVAPYFDEVAGSVESEDDL